MRSSLAVLLTIGCALLVSSGCADLLGIESGRPRDASAGGAGGTTHAGGSASGGTERPFGDAFAGSSTTLVDDAGAGSSIAVDAERVYWASNGEVRSAPKDALGDPPLLHEPDPVGEIDVFVDALYVYWSVDPAMSCENRVRRRTKANNDGPIQSVFSPCPAEATGRMKGSTTALLVVVDDSVHLVPPMEAQTGIALQIPAAPLAIALGGGTPFAATATQVFELVVGGPPREISSEADFPTDMVADDTHVYWAAATGGIKSMARDGSGAVATVADGQAGVTRMAIDDAGVYWTATDDGVVRGYDKAQGGVADLAADQDAPTAITVDADALYWVNEGDGTIARLLR